MPVYSGLTSLYDDYYDNGALINGATGVDPSRALLLFTVHSVHGDEWRHVSGYISVDGKSVTFERYPKVMPTSDQVWIQWVVIEKSTWTVYSGTADTQTGAGGLTTVDVTLPVAVSLANSWPVFSFHGYDQASVTNKLPWTAKFTSTTNLRFQRESAPASADANHPRIRWQVVVDPDATVQEVSSGSISASSVNQSISSCDPAKTALFCSFRDATATLGRHKPYVTKQDSSTNLLRTRGTIFGAQADHVVHAVTWSDSTAVTSYERTPSGFGLTDNFSISVDADNAFPLATGFPQTSVAKSGSSTTQWNLNTYSLKVTGSEMQTETGLAPGLTSGIVHRFQVIELPSSSTGTLTGGWFHAKGLK
jgi:hypothetical protein